MRRFRFGLSAATAGSVAEWKETARAAESLGFDVLLVSDHLGDQLSPMPAVVAAADATERLRVGTLVLDNDFRHPVLAAMEAATVDLLTEGRFEFGIGAGWMAEEYEQAGIPFDPGPVRVQRLEEAVVRMKALWEEHSRRPRLLIGGAGPRILRLAARQADIVGLTGLQHRDRQRDLSGFVAESLERRLEILGAAPLERQALVQRVEVTDDRRGAAERIRERVSELTVDQILESPFFLLGSHDEMAEQLRARRDRFGISYWVVFGRDRDAFAPVIPRLQGE